MTRLDAIRQETHLIEERFAVVAGGIIDVLPGLVAVGRHLGPIEVLLARLDAPLPPLQLVVTQQARQGKLDQVAAVQDHLPLLLQLHVFLQKWTSLWPRLAGYVACFIASRIASARD